MNTKVVQTRCQDVCELVYAFPLAFRLIPPATSQLSVMQYDVGTSAARRSSFKRKRRWYNAAACHQNDVSGYYNLSK